MSFSRKECLFSHSMTKNTMVSQPVAFKIDLRELIPCCYDYSALFVIENMSVTAYKQSTLEKIPVKFTVLNSNKRRVLTHDPCKISSKWPVDLPRGSHVKIAGTDSTPFCRSPSLWDEESRQALVNILAFMMSDSLWFSDAARGALAILEKSSRGEFNFKCRLCSKTGLARFREGEDGLPSFSLTRCKDDYVCVPSSTDEEDQVALEKLAGLLRSASLDNLDVLNRVTKEMAARPSCLELDCTSFPPVHRRTGDVVIPHEIMKHVTSLYQTMIEYADNFVIVSNEKSDIHVLIESPSANVGEVTGCMTLTIIYGSSLSEIHRNLCLDLHNVEGRNEQQHDCPVNATQLTDDVLVRRTPLRFMVKHTMSLRDWFEFHHYHF